MCGLCGPGADVATVTRMRAAVTGEAVLAGGRAPGVRTLDTVDTCTPARCAEWVVRCHLGTATDRRPSSFSHRRGAIPIVHDLAQVP